MLILNIIQEIIKSYLNLLKKQVLKRNGHAPPRDEKDDTSENSEGGEEGEEEVVGYIVQLDTSAKNASSETFGRLDVGHQERVPSRGDARDA